MDSFGKEIFDMIEAHFGRHVAKIVLGLVVLAVAGLALQAAYTTILEPAVSGVVYLVKALGAKEAVFEAVRAIAQLAGSLMGLAVGWYGFGYLERRATKQTQEYQRRIVMTLSGLENILTRAREVAVRIRAEESTEKKLELLDDLVEGLNPSELPGTQLLQGIEQKKQQ